MSAAVRVGPAEETTGTFLKADPRRVKELEGELWHIAKNAQAGTMMEAVAKKIVSKVDEERAKIFAYLDNNIEDSATAADVRKLLDNILADAHREY